MSRATIRIDCPSDELLGRLNSRVYPVCEMVRRPERLVAEYSVPESYATWFLQHCCDLGIQTRKLTGTLSLLEQLAADDLEE